MLIDPLNHHKLDGRRLRQQTVRREAAAALSPLMMATTRHQIAVGRHSGSKGEPRGKEQMTELAHDGYVAEIEIDPDAALLSGIVLNTRATLHFSGGSVDDLRQAFAGTIADYREWCRQGNVEPEKPYSGRLSLRIAPELHRHIAEQAAKAGESINQFIAERLGEVA